MIVVAAMEGQGQDRHVVNGVGLDQRPGDRMGDAIEIGLKLLVEPDDGGLKVLTDKESHDQEGLSGHRGRIDILHPRQLVEQLFHRDGEPFLHFLRRGPRHRDHDIDHRYLDLRFFLARQHDDCQDAKEQRGDNAQRG